MKHIVGLLCAAAFAAATGAALADGDAAKGEKKFEECHACHSLDKNAESVGPSLYGVFGRKAGTLADFRYSPAMKRSNIVWSPEGVDAFITDPQKAVPANRMPYAGMANAADRADLIAFLQKQFK